MAILSKVGVFAKATSAAPASQALTGIGFTPKALILWTAGGTTDDTVAGGIVQGIGFASGPSVGAAQAAADADGVTPSQAARRVIAKAFTLVNAAQTVVAECDLASFDVDGFTLNWTTNNAVAYRINYLALGGDSLTAAKAFKTVPTTTISGIGFQPDLIFLAHTGSTANGTAAAAVTSFGAADRALNQWALQTIDSNAVNPSDTQRGLRTDVVAGTMNTGVSPNWNQTWALTGMTADGCTLLRGGVSGTAIGTWLGLALQGSGLRAGNLVKATSAAPLTQTVAGLGMQPSAILLAGVQDIDQVTVPSPQARFALAAADGTTARTSLYSATDNVSPTQAKALETPHAYVKANNASLTAEAVAELASRDADGFTLNWTTNDAVATVIGYVAFGPAAAPVTTAARAYAVIVG